MRGLLGFLLVLAVPGAAQAEWLESSSAHFVVYADDGPENLRRFSEQLERYHVAVTGLLGIREPAPSPSNRVTVYVVKSESQVRKLIDDKTGFVAGFYIPRAGGSLAVLPPVDAATGDLEFPMIILLHEYAHHVTLSGSATALPRWLTEGSAEFFASAKFNRDGSLEIGKPAVHRGGELFLAKNVSLNELFQPDEAKRAQRRSYDNFYGRSWLLYHYLTLGPSRKGQLSAYLTQVNAGKTSLEAAQAVFGDLRTLDRELDDYMRRGRMMEIKMPPLELDEGAVTIRDLSAGEAAMMPVRIRSKRGVNREQALELLPEAQKVAAAYPRDAAVLAVLAEAEHDAGHYDAAIAAADAALAIDADQVNAYVQKGFALFAKAQDAEPEEKKAAYAKAREPFLALNKVENDHPLPLLYFYLSYALQDQSPGKTAVAALRRASELAPFDLNLRMTLAVQDLRDGDREGAMANFKPLAFNPHGGAFAERVRDVLERLQAGEAPDSFFKEGKFVLEEEPEAGQASAE